MCYTYAVCILLSLAVCLGLGEEGGYIEGDIIPFPTPSTRTLRGANDIISDYTEGTLWPNNTVYFMHDSNLSGKCIDQHGTS